MDNIIDISSEKKQIQDEIDLLKKFTYSTKLKWIKNFVNEKFSREKDSKIVIFSQFATMLDLTEVMLIQEGVKW